MAAGAGVGISFGFGFYVVSWKTKERIKEELRNPSPATEEAIDLLTEKIMTRGVALASERLQDPSPQLRDTMQSMTFHLVGNASQIAQHEDAKALFRPFIDLAVNSVDEAVDMTIKNIAKQRSKGEGAFNPENYTEAELNEIAQDVKQEFIESSSGILDGFTDALGLSDAGKKKVRAFVVSKFLRGNDGRSRAAQHSPTSKGGYTPLGGR